MLKKFSAVILLAAMLFLASCGKEPTVTSDESKAEIISETDLSKTSGDAVTESAAEKPSGSTKAKTEEKISVTTKAEKGEKNTEAKSEKAEKSTVKITTTTAVVNSEPISEIYNGISLLSKSSPVARGYSASVTIMGTPNEKFTIEFYKNGTKNPVKLSGLSEKSSNDMGIVTWNFTVPSDCSLGNNMIIIKQSGSKNKLQTSIIVE